MSNSNSRQTNRLIKLKTTRKKGIASLKFAGEEQLKNDWNISTLYRLPLWFIW